ncbi:acyltransferase family protein [Promicromonospora panici]|uniref:acyltransferase family protein n=1 Tax=Promicromonospora panici TaxID=2219658 RepID=UPI0013ED2576|nr:acyltransferase family protein [Promicromonospora panici]
MTVVSSSLPPTFGPADPGIATGGPSLPDGVSPPERSATGRRPTAVHIPELHGLRGLALALVVAFHLFGNGRVSGGVDVFLVLSGFLATGSLLRRAERRELRLGEHYGRTFSRLVPPALLVLVATAALAWWIMPRGMWVQTGREILASALYYVNWEMISGQLAYGAAGPQTSPLQHFWSMSVQGQFFLVWPVVVLVVVALARRLWISARDVLLVVVIGTTAASFVYALNLHALDQPVAYFHSWARFWELGVGGFLALALPWLRFPGFLRPLLGWAGLGLVVSSGFVLDGGALFPGPWALWPVAGALLVLLGSGGSAGWGPRGLLQLAPLRFVADISYALYLWHWPLLIAYLHYTGQDRVDWVGAALILTTSVVLSWLTTKLVADPAQRFREAFGGVRALVAAAACASLVAGGTVAAVTELERQDAQLLAAAEAAAEAAGPSQYPGALALSPAYGDPVPGDLAIQPAPAVAAQDLPDVDAQDCIQDNVVTPGSDAARSCVLTDGPDPDHTVVMVGDSHIIQWAPAMAEVGRQENWRVQLMARRGCRLAAPVGQLGPASNTDKCWSWRINALAALEQLRPDAVLVVGSRTSANAPGDTVIPAEARAWRRLAATGIRVVTIRDNPRFAFDVPACVESHPDGVGCARPRTDVYSPVNPVETAQGVPQTAVHVDLTRFICGVRLCEGAAGNVLIYRDDNHLTATYAATLTRPLHNSLRMRAPWLFVDPMDTPPVRTRF